MCNVVLMFLLTLYLVENENITSFSRGSVLNKLMTSKHLHYKSRTQPLIHSDHLDDRITG